MTANTVDAPETAPRPRNGLIKQYDLFHFP